VGRGKKGKKRKKGQPHILSDPGGIRYPEFTRAEISADLQGHEGEGKKGGGGEEKGNKKYQ